MVGYNSSSINEFYVLDEYLLFVPQNQKDKRGVVMDIAQWLVEHWQMVAIGILLLDKAVALSPMKQDDLIWASVKGAIMKLAGKDK